MPGDDQYAFEKVAHGRLAFKAGRRQLFPALLSELQAFNNNADGMAVAKLSDLGNCTDEEIARMVPSVVSGCQISLVDDHVYGQPPVTSKPFELFPTGIPALTVFNMFNGMTTIAEVSDHLSESTGWDSQRAFAYTRGVFLWLVVAGICMPTGL